MERGDWDNDPEYPRAPLPAHERVWRHPSEIGESQWVQSEPPLVVGRGLSVATGTVGVVLAIGLLWLMIPHNNRGGVAAEASTSSAGVTLATIATTAVGRQSTTLPTIVRPTTTAATAPTTVVQSSPPPTPPTTVTTTQTSPAPPTTAQAPTSPTMVIGVETAPEGSPAVAVALVPGHLVVTTAGAVRGREGFAVQLPSGETVTGAVVWVDQQLGTAVLSVSVDVADLIEPSQADPAVGGFTVLNAAATLSSDDTGTQVQYAAGVEPAEGSLVLDSDGRLVGMCTMGSSSVHMVGVDSLLDALTAASSAASVPAWLGIKAEASATGAITVAQVLDGGPAATAGVLTGDVILAVDGVPITDLDSLRAGVTAHSAGEMVTVTVVHPGTTDPVDVVVTLSQQPWSL